MELDSLFAILNPSYPRFITMQFPQDAFYHVLSFCQPHEVFKSRRVCNQWNEDINRSSSLWKNLLQVNHPYFPYDDIHYKQILRELHTRKQNQLILEDFKLTLIFMKGDDMVAKHRYMLQSENEITDGVVQSALNGIMSERKEGYSVRLYASLRMSGFPTQYREQTMGNQQYHPEWNNEQQRFMSFDHSYENGDLEVAVWKQGSGKTKIQLMVWGKERSYMIGSPGFIAVIVNLLKFKV